MVNFIFHGYLLQTSTVTINIDFKWNSSKLDLILRILAWVKFQFTILKWNILLAGVQEVFQKRNKIFSFPKFHFSSSLCAYSRHYQKRNILNYSDYTHQKNNSFWKCSLCDRIYEILYFMEKQCSAF